MSYNLDTTRNKYLCMSNPEGYAQAPACPHFLDGKPHAGDISPWTSIVQMQNNKGRQRKHAMLKTRMVKNGIDGQLRQRNTHKLSSLSCCEPLCWKSPKSTQLFIEWPNDPFGEMTDHSQAVDPGFSTRPRTGPEMTSIIVIGFSIVNGPPCADATQ